MQTSTFVFDSYEIDLSKQRFIFRYSLTQGDEQFAFVEELRLPKKIERDIPRKLLDTISQQLHLILGISYWKLFCPPQIIVKPAKLDDKQATFWNTLYTKGLGEFFYRNAIDYRGLVHFPVTAVAPTPISLPLSNRSMVGIGGGKDSIVSVELLKKAGKQFAGYTLLKHTSPIIDETITIAGIERLSVQRVMDPQILKISRRADVYEGHVPISSIYAFVGVLLGILYDYSYVISSNEQSASYGNVEYLGEMINHQWSKSVEFEQMFQKYIHDYVTPDITYFSLLRPWYEIKIADIFSRYPRYFNTFSSCNRNFSDTNPARTKWCGECPKCAFVFAILAGFLSREQVLSIFGQNVFAKQSLLPLYKELLGMEGIKPFECVGTPAETQVAFIMAHERKEYDEDNAMKLFVEECLPHIKNIEELKQRVFEAGNDSLVPADFRNVIKN